MAQCEEVNPNLMAIAPRIAPRDKRPRKGSETRARAVVERVADRDRLVVDRTWHVEVAFPSVTPMMTGRFRRSASWVSRGCPNWSVEVSCDPKADPTASVGIDPRTWARRWREAA